MPGLNRNNEARCVCDLFGCLNSGIENKGFGALVPHRFYIVSVCVNLKENISCTSLKFTLFDHIFIQNLFESIYKFGANIPKARGSFL